MANKEIARKYSQALFMLGKEQNNLSPFQQELGIVWKVISGQKELKSILFDNRLLPEEKKKVLKRAFSKNISKPVLSFIFLLIDKRREEYLEAIIKEFAGLVNRQLGILEVEVISAVGLTDALERKLEKKLVELFEKKIKVKNIVDPAIMGGVIIKTGDNMIDGSIRSRLNSLGKKLEQIPASKLGVE